MCGATENRFVHFSLLESGRLPATISPLSRDASPVSAGAPGTFNTEAAVSPPKAGSTHKGSFVEVFLDVSKRR